MKAFGKTMAAASTMVLLGLPGVGFGYETDLHYGLTYWLAGKAGFASRQQHDIARGNERTDTGMMDAKHAVVWQLCIKRDETAGELTRGFHFRSQEPGPAHPSKRHVDSGAPFASLAVDAVIAEKGTNERDSIIRFGRALHGWQDSFSHKGEPGALPACPEDWAWGHPRTRHGPLSHDADLTHVFPADCLEAARTTYGKLQAYRQQRNLPLGDAPWPDLAPDVERFCAAETKADKTRWLRDHDVRQPEAIASSLSLPDGIPRPARESLDLGELPPTQDGRVVDLVEGARHVLTTVPAQTWFQSFCQTWMSTSAENLAPALSAYFGANVKLTATDEAIDALLRLRLIDRGVANTSDAIAAIARERPEAFITTPHNRWRGPFVPVRFREFPVLVGDTDEDGHARPSTRPGSDETLVPSGKYFTSIMILAHAPNDVLLVRAEQTGDGYRVTSVNVLLFH